MDYSPRRPLTDREEARRINHSAIEKKRRVKLASALLQLQDLVPRSRTQRHIQKLQVLENAIDYILEMRQNLQLEQEGNGSLEGSSQIPMSPSNSCSSGESTRSTVMSIKNLLT